MLREPEHALQEVAKVYAGMPPVTYQPPEDRWANLPITASVLGKGEGTLRIVMLGDSIVNDTSRSRWDDLLRKAYPEMPDRSHDLRAGRDRMLVVQGAVAAEAVRAGPQPRPADHRRHQPQGRHRLDPRGDPRRTHRPGSATSCLMTGAFGTIDPRDDTQWRPDIDPKGTDYRSRLKRLADEEKTGFLDMTGALGALHPRVWRGPGRVQARPDPRQHPGRADPGPYPVGLPGAAGAGALNRAATDLGSIRGWEVRSWLRVQRSRSGGPSCRGGSP